MIHFRRFPILPVSILPVLRRLQRPLAVCALLLAVLSPSRGVAQTNGTWTNLSGGTWGVTTNWSDGVVAGGADAVANFNTLDITSGRIVFLDQDVTLGKLIVGDTVGSSFYSVRSDNVANRSLTFATATGQPIVETPNADSPVSFGKPTNDAFTLSITGTQGLIKQGPGDLYVDLAPITGLTGGLWIKEGSFTGYGSNVPSGTITLGDGSTTVSLRNQTVKSALSISNAITVNAGEQTITQQAGQPVGGVSGTISGVGSLLLLPTTDANRSGQANFGNAASTYAGGTRIGAVGGNILVSALLASSSTNAQGAVTQGPYGTGTVTLDGGGLMAASPVSRTLHNAVVVQQDAVLGDANSAVITRNLTLAGPMTLAGGTRALEIRIGRTGGEGNVTIDGVIGDGGNGYGLTIRSGGTVSAANDVLVLGGANTYTGDTLVESGVLRLTNSLALQNTALDTSGSGAVALSGITAATVGGLKGGTALASVITGSYSALSSLTLNPGTGKTAAYSGVISDGAAGMALTKAGNGIQELSGVNSYSGATTITAGQLRIAAGDINSSSGITLDGATAELRYNAATALSAPLTFTQGTLSGTGTIGTAVTVGTNTVISPGNSPGTQSYTSLHAWAPGGTYKWELNALTGTAGNNWDLVNVTSGTFSLAALAPAPGSQFILDLTTLAAGDVAGQLVNPYDGGSYTFAIASYDPANFFLPDGFSNTAGADLTSLFTFNNLTNWQGTQPQVADISVKINSTATGIDLVIVPEPGTLALAGLGLAAAAWAAHRRRRGSHTRGSSNPAR
jgi:autotransporter-associated beta strand protein